MNRIRLQCIPNLRTLALTLIIILVVRVCSTQSEEEKVAYDFIYHVHENDCPVFFCNQTTKQSVDVLDYKITWFANWIDNLLRPRLVPRGAYLHPMLLLLSVFGGLSVAGLVGVVYGPVIMILFVTTIEVYRKYYLGIDKLEDLISEPESAS